MDAGIMALNLRQTKFVHYYLKLGNRTQAAIKAGFSEKTAGSIGWNLLKNVEIAAAIREGQSHIKSKLLLTAAKVVHEIQTIAFASISEEVKASDKLSALDKLAKHLGIFLELEEVERLKAELTELLAKAKAAHRVEDQCETTD